jgi:hypothetical protein
MPGRDDEQAESRWQRSEIILWERAFSDLSLSKVSRDLNCDFNYLPVDDLTNSLII